MNELGEAIADHIERAGPIGFDEYVAHALYTPGLGFYAGGGGAGRRRDFLTSPEVGPLFGTVVARALDTWWAERGEPDRFVVVEAGAGPGTLARTVLAAAPRCADALDLVLVEPAQTQWRTHPDGVTSRTDLPAPGSFGGAPVVVLANELLDNLPFGLVELTDRGWAEVVIGVEDHEPGAPGPPRPPASSGDAPSVVPGAARRSTGRGTPSSPGRRLVEGHVLLDPRRAAWCRGKAGREAAIGTRIPVLADAAAWLAGAIDLASGPGGGRVVVVDYGSSSQALARRPWTEWVRTYADHGRAGHPLEAPGTCDITVEVPVDQLATVEDPTLDRSQAEFLRSHGIDELVEEGASRWRELGIAGGLEAVAARSRVHEADALLDPAGLGAFRVLEWERPPT